MTQISRPFQIALAVLVLFVAVWFVALRGHSPGGEGSGSGSSATSPSSASSSAGSSAPGGGTPASKGGVYHGSAPGVEGLSRAIHRAQGAVAQSQQNAKQLQQKSQEASSSAQQGQTQSAQGRQAQTRQQSQSQSQRQQQSQRSHAVPANGVPAMQAVVEGELKRGQVVAVLFWNPKGSVDATVRRELHAAGGALHGKLAVHVARAAAVGSFGSFTHAVKVYSTPTILLINDKGGTSSLTGLADAFAIEQAVKRVKQAK